MGGGPGHVAILADCERALGNPERALDLARSPEAAQLDEEGAAELRIVASGARADLGQLDAAMAVLQDGPGFDLDRPEPWSARLYYAYADLLLTASRSDEALQWFVRADDADDDGDTDAADRIADLIAIRDGGGVAASDAAQDADGSSDVPGVADSGDTADTERDTVAGGAELVTDDAALDDSADDIATASTDVAADIEDDDRTGTAPIEVAVDEDNTPEDAEDAEDAAVDHVAADDEDADDEEGADQELDGRPTPAGEVPIGRGSVLFSSGQES